MIFDKFYTYEMLGEDMIIYTWQFEERNEDGLLVYYNEQNDTYTECVPYDDPDDFRKENELYLSILDIALDFEEFKEEILDVDFDDDVFLSIVVKKDE